MIAAHLLSPNRAPSQGADIPDDARKDGGAPRLYLLKVRRWLWRHGAWWVVGGHLLCALPAS